MATLADIEIRLSGGASNTSAAAALGGAMSTVAGGVVLSQSATALTTITGVVINDAAGNAEGDGTMAFDSVATTLTWTPPGGVAGAAIDVSADGDYSIQGANDGGYLDVTVTAASLPGGSLTNTSTIANQANKIFDDVSKAESLAGDIEYRCVYLENAHASESMIGVVIWMDANTPGQDTVQIALDPAGLNGTATTIGDEDTEPTGPDFDAANPVDAASGLAIGTLAFGDQYPFWIRRTVPVSTTEEELNNTFRIGIRAYV